MTVFPRMAAVSVPTLKTHGYKHEVPATRIQARSASHSVTSTKHERVPWIRTANAERNTHLLALWVNLLLAFRNNPLLAPRAGILLALRVRISEPAMLGKGPSRSPSLRKAKISYARPTFEKKWTVTSEEGTLQMSLLKEYHNGMTRYAVILPAAGSSKRFGHPMLKKVFVDLKGSPVWLRSVEAFIHRPEVVQTVLVVAPDDLEWFRDRFSANLAFMDLQVVSGGKERADSVQNALAVIAPEVDYIAVHDAARPLVSPSEIDAVFDAARTHGAAILALPMANTIKRVESGKIIETVDRTGLYAALTPQVFERQLLLDAYAQRGDSSPTDEAQLVERLGRPVAVVDGSPLNIKMTVQEDLRMAAALLPLVSKGDSLNKIDPSDENKPGLW